MKKMLSMLIIVALILIACDNKTGLEEGSTFITQSSNIGNALPYPGLGDQQGDFIYSYEQGVVKQIIKLNEKGKQKKIIAKLDAGETVKQVVVVGEWVYYPVFVDSQSENGPMETPLGLRKTKIDGSETVEISSDSIESIVVKENTVYYTLSELEDDIYQQDGNIYKMDTNGGDKETISTADQCLIELYGIVSDKIIYLYNDNIYSLDLDKKNKVNLSQISSDDLFTNCVTSDGEWIYYTVIVDDKYNYDIYRVKPNGDKREKIATIKGNDYEFPMINAKDGYVYYMDCQEKGQTGIESIFYRIRYDGSEQMEIQRENNCSRISLLENNIMTIDFYGQYKMIPYPEA